MNKRLKAWGDDIHWIDFVEICQLMNDLVLGRVLGGYD